MKPAELNPYLRVRAKAVALEWAIDTDEIEKVLAGDMQETVRILRRGRPQPEPVWLPFVEDFYDVV